MRWARAAISLGLGCVLGAADAPQLPPPPPPIPLLHRGPNGAVETLDPETEIRLGHKLCDPIALCVGKAQTYHTLAAALARARDGDVVEIVAGRYRETARITQARLTLRGAVGRAHLDCAGLAPTDDAGCVVLAADGITLEDLEISGAEAPGGDAACIRGGENMSLTLRDVICHGSQDGLMATGGTILIERSEFFDNGAAPENHNVALAGNCVATVRSSVFRDARSGAELTSRCVRTEITDSTFRSTHGDGDIDIPDAGETLIYRSTLEKAVGAQGLGLVSFARETCRNPGSMLLKDVRIINARPRAEIHNFDRCADRPVVIEGLIVDGAPLAEQGYILRQ